MEMQEPVVELMRSNHYGKDVAALSSCLKTEKEIF
jgi:hypothetical protein